jgi:hypothetical protein
MQSVYSDSNGLFSLSLPTQRTYFFTLLAPGFYPDQREFDWVWLSQNQPLMNLHSPFGRGGSVLGRVVNTSGAGVPGAWLVVGQPNAGTTTDANGDYAFSNQEPSDSKFINLYPPYPYVNHGGDLNGFRLFPLPPNSVAIENYLVERRGQLTIHAQQTIGSQAIPVGYVFFNIQDPFGNLTLTNTGLNGQASQELNAGTYTITPDLIFLPAGTIITPASHTVNITNETFANVVFTVTPLQSLAVECEAGGEAFACTVEIYDSNGNLVTSIDLGSASPGTVITDLPSGSYEVVIVPAEPGWPESSSVVNLNGNTHAEVNYPFNPSNLQTISGFAYWDRCYPGRRAFKYQLLHRNKHPQQQRNPGDALQCRRCADRYHADRQWQ